jgi:hypothetical protein
MERENVKSVATYLDLLVRETHKPEAEVMAMAVQAGLHHLWREHVLGRYLRGDITHEAAIAEVGSVWVDLAQRQRQAVSEDLAWALDV